MKHLYPIITTPSVLECRDFYVSTLDAKVLFQKDWYVHLAVGSFEIGFLHPEPPVRPPVFQHATLSRGLCFALEVANVQLLYGEFAARGVQILAPLKQHQTGEYAFSVMDPAGIVLNVVERHLEDSDTEIF